MNCSFDEHGPVEVNELMAIHRQKMEKKILMTDTSNGKDGEPTIDKISHDLDNVDSQKCVGNQLNSKWASTRIAHRRYKNLLNCPNISHSHHIHRIHMVGRTSPEVRTYVHVAANE